MEDYTQSEVFASLYGRVLWSGETWPVALTVGEGVRYARMLN
jgi:hypothetical protein